MNETPNGVKYGTQHYLKDLYKCPPGTHALIITHHDAFESTTFFIPFEDKEELEEHTDIMQYDKNLTVMVIGEGSGKLKDNKVDVYNGKYPKPRIAKWRNSK